MNDLHFDRLTRILASTPSRRGMVAGLVAGSLAVAGVSQATAKPGKGRGNAKGRGRGRGQGQTKVGLCHHSEEEGTYHFISVGQPAVAAHERHGDVVCPTSTDPCLSYTSCDPETDACVAVAAEDDTVCTDSAGASGTCQGGVCTTV
ncbi:MAG: hypothetical protein M3354_04180 [Chloroflexota bacterium]|nr:hypothetical protein [Chloroflexota bacterium]